MISSVSSSVSASQNLQTLQADSRPSPKVAEKPETQAPSPSSSKVSLSDEAKKLQEADTAAPATDDTQQAPQQIESQSDVGETAASTASAEPQRDAANVNTAQVQRQLEAYKQVEQNNQPKPSAQIV